MINLAKAKVTLSPNSFEYNGQAQYPEKITVVLDGVELNPETDYTIKFPNDVVPNEYWFKRCLW